MLPVKAITLMDLLSPILWLVNELTAGIRPASSPRASPPAYVKNGHPTPCCFVDVTNRSSKSWSHACGFATNPPVGIVNPYRPLPREVHSHDRGRRGSRSLDFRMPGMGNSVGSVSPATTQFSHDQTAPPYEAAPRARP